MQILTTLRSVERCFKSANLLIIFSLLLTGCLRGLNPDDPCETPSNNLLVMVDIHWDGIPSQDKPLQGMAVHLFPWEGSGQSIWDNLPRMAGKLLLPWGYSYSALCYDYYGNETIYFRNNNDRDRIEAYSTLFGGLINEEPAVTEPYPYTFFVAYNEEKFSVIPPPDSDTLHLHFYPQNVLKEFTFLIYDAGIL